MSGITATLEKGLSILTIETPERRNPIGYAVPPRAYVKDFLALEVDRILEFERQIQPPRLFRGSARHLFQKRAVVFRGI